MVGTHGLPVPQTGLPQGPPPHVHILPCPYYTRIWRADSYSRGDRKGRYTCLPDRMLHFRRQIKCNRALQAFYALM